MHKLRHRGVACLERQVWVKLIFHCGARVEVGEGLALYVEERYVHTGVEAPVVVNCHLVLAIDVPLRGGEMAS